jgi:hypothetical protein
MRRTIAIGVAVAVVLALVVAQLVLPGIAADQLRDRLSPYGRVLEVQVTAFPAIELLWGDADRVLVRMASYRSTRGRLSSLLSEAAGVGTIDASAAVLQSGLLRVRRARLLKRGDELVGTATVTESDLRAAVPFLDNVRPLESSDGGLTLQGTATLFGLTATADATVSARAGRLVVAPDVPFGGLATITLFSDPQVAVESITASPAPGGFTVTVRARLT